METMKTACWLWPAAVSGCRRTRGFAGLGIASAATLILFTAACGGTARPANTTPEPLSVNTTVALAAPIAATPAAPAGVTSAPTPAASDAGKKAAKRDAPATLTPTPAASDTGKKAAKRAALATVQLTAGAVTRSIQQHNPTAGQVQTVTSQNDPDGQLGTPNQYTSRADFVDTALATGGDWSLADGGAVEVFGTAADAARAKKQLQAGNGGSAPSEIDYQTGPILLRLSPRLPQSQIADYEKATKDTLKAAVKAAAGRKSGKKSAAATPAPAP